MVNTGARVASMSELLTCYNSWSLGRSKMSPEVLQSLD